MGPIASKAMWENFGHDMETAVTGVNQALQTVWSYTPTGALYSKVLEPDIDSLFPKNQTEGVAVYTPGIQGKFNLGSY